MKDFYVLRNKYLAYGLAFCGFNYRQYTNNEGRTVYSFKNSDKLQETIQYLLNVRNSK